MDSKLSSIVITSLLAFALIAGVPAVFENVIAQQDGSGQSGGDAGMDRIWHRYGPIWHRYGQNLAQVWTDLAQVWANLAQV